MKFFNLMLAASMAAMVFSSCSKEEGGADISDKSLKSVTISLANVKAQAAAQTMGTRSALEEEIKNGTQVKLTNFQVFFSNGTNLYLGKAADGSPITHFFVGENMNTETSKSFHFLPASVNKVIVIGNVRDAEGAVITSGNSSITVTEGTSTEENTLKNVLNLQIDKQQDAEELTLYGDCTTLQPKQGDHNSGDDAHANPVYEAEVNIAPLVARIEVKNIKCTDFGSYAEFKLEKFAFNNYYKNIEADTKTPSEIVRTKITPENVFDYFNALEKTEGTTPWHWEEFSNAVLAKSDKTEVNDTPFYYHFFVDGKKFTGDKINGNETEGYPQLLLKLTGYSGSGQSGTETPLYLATTTLNSKSTPITQFEAGKIYQVSFSFSEDNISQPDKCIEVTVKVASWTIVPDVTVSFE